MSITPAPFTLTCQHCSWKKTLIPNSELLVLDRDWLSTCPNCHSTSLRRRPATYKEELRVRLEQFLEPGE